MHRNTVIIMLGYRVSHERNHAEAFHRTFIIYKGKCKKATFLILFSAGVRAKIAVLLNLKYPL